MRGGQTWRQWRIVGELVLGGLLVSLAAGLLLLALEPWLASTAPGDAAAPGAGAPQSLALAIAALIGASGLFLHAYRIHAARFRLASDGRAMPAVAVLILPVSLPARPETTSAYDQAAMLEAVKALLAGSSKGTAVKWGFTAGSARDGLPGEEDLRRPDLWIERDDAGHRLDRFAWITGLRLVAACLGQGQGRLRAVHLVPSTETIDLARDHYRGMVEGLARRLFGREVVTTSLNRDPTGDAGHLPEGGRLKVEWHEAVDYRDFEAVGSRIRQIVDQEMRNGGAIVIDVTGGSSSFTAAAALEAVRARVCYAYSPPADGRAGPVPEPKFYDVVTDYVSAAGPAFGDG